MLWNSGEIRICYRDKIMTMKHLLPILALILAISASAAEQPTATLPITKAIIYQEGAQVYHLGPVALYSGQHTIAITGLTADIIENSLQLSLGKGVVIESINLLEDIKTDPTDKTKVDDINGKIELLMDSIRLIDVYQQIYEDEKQVIAQNSSIKGNDGLSAAEVETFSDFYRQRRMEIENKVLSLKYEKKTLHKKAIELKQSLVVLLGTKSQTYKKLEVVYSTKSAQTVEASLSYLINEAGWTPSYDIRVESVTEPLQWAYKASVFQNSGIDWTDIKVAFATGFPSANLTKPVLENYYLTPHNFYSSPKRKAAPTQHNYITGMVVDVMNEPLLFATVLEVGTSNATETDLDGSFSLKLTNPDSKIEVSYVGYTTKIHTPTEGNNTIVLEEGALLDEIAIVAYKAQNIRPVLAGSSGHSGRKKTEYQVPLAIKKNVTQRLFELDEVYTVESNAEQKKITMLTYNIESDYRYEIVPKVEEKAYLVTVIKDWLQYEFLSGRINIYFNDIYQGNYFLDLEKEKEELIFSVGVDPNIKVSRTQRKDYDDGNFFGDKVTSKLAWDLEVYNGHPYAAEFRIVDQVPVSKSDRIEVDIKELSAGELNEDTGIVKWKQNIAGKTTEKLSLVYHVKSKKVDKVIVE